VWTPYATGDTIKIRLKTDSSVTYYGFQVTKYEYNAGTGDTTAPTVSITAPSNGATLSGATTITASASDNVGVTQVDFYLDNVLKGSDTSSPYSCAWDTNAYANGAHTIYAKAKDAAGNVGTSSTISVTVSNTVVDDGGKLTDGVTANGNMDSTDGADMWYIDVGASAASFYAVLTCGSADFDLFGKFNTQPTTSSYDWRGYTAGGEECTVTSPAQGRHYIMVDYYSGTGTIAYQLTVTITYSTPSADILPWWNDAIDTEKVTQTGNGVVVVVLDTGICSDWATRFRSGTILSQYATSYSNDGVAWNGDSADGVGGGGHGTATAATIAGYLDNSGTYVKGSAPDAKIVPVRVRFYHYGTTASFNEMINSIRDAVNYARSLHSGSLAGMPMVVSMSIGWSAADVSSYGVTTANNDLRTAIQGGIGEGLIFSFSAGNSGPTADTVGYPALWSESIAVGAAAHANYNSFTATPAFNLDFAENAESTYVAIASFSSRGNAVDIVGMGHRLLLPQITTGTTSVIDYISGTSFSCPQVSGLIALMLQKTPTLTQSQVEQILRNTAIDLGTAGFDTTWGYGFVQADAAVAAA
jgi:subtilisin family serine protease